MRLDASSWRDMKIRLPLQAVMFPANVRSATDAERVSGVRAAVVAGGVVGMFLAAVLAFAAPASASPSLVVSPSTGLNPTRDFVTVTGRGFKPNIQLFVMQCRSTSGEDHTCNSVGLQKVMTDSAGSFTKGGVMVTARFGATDCTVTPCAIKTSAVQGHSGDRSQDRLAPISFGTSATTPPVVPAPTAPPVATTTPVTAPPVAVTTTTAAPVTTGSSTTVPATTTTDSESSKTTTTQGATTSTTEEQQAAALAAGNVDGDSTDDVSTDGGGGGGSSGAWLVALAIVALAGAGGAAYYVRNRSASA